MDADKWKLVKHLLDSALELEPDERTRFLNRSCNDESLKAEVLALIRAQDTHSFLDQRVEGSNLEKGMAGLSSGEMAGPWKIGVQLGRGGMGAVYLATRDDHVQMKAAVKVLRSGLSNEQILARFLKERHILGQLEHPHIARLLDGGALEDGQPYIAMEYVDGEPITQYCDSRNLGIRERLSLFRKVCDAVHFAHRNLVVHRDIKPGNILVNGEGEPKLLDFGIARLLESQDEEAVTVTGQQVMTPEYASPEQILGQNITTSSDIYSLGVLLYEMLTGQRPFQLKTQSSPELFRAICEQEPPKPSSIVLMTFEKKNTTITPEMVSQSRNLQPRKLQTSLSGDIDKMVLMALRKDPQRRYPTALSFADDIGRYLKGFPVLARKETMPYLVSKFVHRHKLAVALSLLFVGVMIVFSLALFKQQQKAEMERDRAVKERDQKVSVTNFMIGVLSESDPYRYYQGVFEEGQGGNLTVRAVLDEAARNIVDLEAAPLVRSALMDAIGVIYVNLGLLESASPLLEQALAIRQDVLGENHLDTGLSYKAFGWLTQKRTQYDLAEKYFLKALAIFELQETPPVSEISDTLNNLAMTFYYRNCYHEAQTILESLSTYDSSQKGYGDFIGNVWLHLGHIAYKNDQYDRAIAYYEDASGAYELYMGQKNGNYPISLDSQGIVYRKLGMYDQAQSCFFAAYDIRREAFPGENSHLAESLNNIGPNFYRKGDYAQAEPYLSQALEIREASFGPNHYMVGRSLNSMAILCRKLNQPERAELFHLRALEIRKTTFGENSDPVAMTSYNLANICLDLGRYGDAARHQENAYRIFSHLMGKDNSKVAHCLVLRAEIDKKLGDLDSAAQLLREALAVFQTHFKADHPFVSGTLENLADVETRVRKAP